MSGRRPLPSRLAAGRLVLRRYEPGDAEALSTAVNESADHLRPFMPWVTDERQTVAQSRTLIEGWRDSDEAVYGMFEPDGRRVVGGCGLHARIGPGALEIGYWVHVDHVRRGHATAAARALTDAAFGVEGIERVEIHCDEANLASAAVPRRLGYRHRRTEDQAPRAPGEVGRKMIWVIERAHHRSTTAPARAAT